MFVGRLVCLVIVVGVCGGCELEDVFNERQVSVETSARSADVVFRGLSASGALPPAAADVAKSHAFFELTNTYKGADALDILNNLRQINVTVSGRNLADCAGDIPREYIVFCKLETDGRLAAVAFAKWDDPTDQRVWRALGWSGWSDWSGCSVSCSAGIQQRRRRCLRPPCPGFNVEQRHCNLFGCYNVVNPLSIESRYFHPSKDHWQKVPDRPSAWRLSPDSYIWLPSTQLFLNATFPREFALFITLRLFNNSLGTIFSLRSRRRQDTYLSLEIAGSSELKLIHASSNGSDVVRVPAPVSDGKWHQIALSIRDDCTVESYVDCEWTRTNILRKGSLDIPDDADLIVGYLFEGDLEQLTIDPNPSVVSLQCSTVVTPIIDPGGGDGFRHFAAATGAPPQKKKKKHHKRYD